MDLPYVLYHRNIRKFAHEFSFLFHRFFTDPVSLQIIRANVVIGDVL